MKKPSIEYRLRKLKSTSASPIGIVINAAIILVVGILLLQAASNTPFPILNGLLQSNMNGGGYSITNAYFVGNGAGLTNVSAAPSAYVPYAQNATNLVALTTVGDLPIGGTSGAITRLAGPTAANAYVLRSTGTGSAATSEVWDNAPALSSTNMSQGSSSSFGVLKGDGLTTSITGGVISVPTGSSSVQGGVKVDGTTIKATGGVISASTATSAALGIVQPDNSTVTINGSGVISVPAGSTSVQGGVKVDGTTIVAVGGVISATGGTGSGNNFKNRIINGDMRMNQRAVTSITSSTAYGLDRWYYSASGANCTLTQNTNPGQGFQYSTLITGATSNTGIVMGQKIEATNIYDLAGSSTCTVSCYAASSSLTSLTMTVYTATGGSDNWSSRSAVAVKTWTISSTLAQYSYTFTFSSDTNGVSVEFTTGALGSTQTLQITGVQLESGSSATSFERTPYTTELAQCQRYYYQIGGTVNALVVTGYQQTAYNCGTAIQFPVTMRVAPTVAIVGSITTSNCATFSTYGTGLNSASVGYACSSTGQWGWQNAANGYLTFSAEL